MASNEKYERSNKLAVVVTDPATPASGDPVRFGERCGVALIAKRTSDNLTTVSFNGVFNLSVKGIDGSGSSAVAEGDKLYYVDADTPKLSKKATGRFFGYAGAGGAIAGNATATIPVQINN